ncbi:Poxvirus protein I5 [Arthrobacter sp. ISL-30]|uniref:Poxvirus protein I5 n=1 Tax=Arthrobacter sp. ISL-30 TaxID=2819109 RepID=UPI001BEA88C1|nr:Poxvirus protein I5 [Arthrobacter sp. ISL-30]MBT2514527.1 Poxvirus protein I5 [Arthrobacter sp. ISL-30]
MSIMDSTGKTSADGTTPVPVNRFALFAETLLAGVIVLALSLPLVTMPAAYAAGIVHLERHLAGRDDSVRSLWGTFRSALPGSWKIGLTTAAAVVVVVLNLLLALVGQLPGRAVVLPATLILAAAGAILLLRTAARWSDFASASAGGSKSAGGTNTAGEEASSPQGAWIAALAAARNDSLRDWSGSLLLLAALFMTVVFVWMLQALVLVVPGTLLLAAAAIKMRAASRGLSPK